MTVHDCYSVAYSSLHTVFHSSDCAETNIIAGMQEQQVHECMNRQAG